VGASHAAYVAISCNQSGESCAPHPLNTDRHHLAKIFASALLRQSLAHFGGFAVTQFVPFVDLLRFPLVLDRRRRDRFFGHLKTQLPNIGGRWTAAFNLPPISARTGDDVFVKLSQIL
jgi:hypothetical protein